MGVDRKGCQKLSARSVMKGMIESTHVSNGTLLLHPPLLASKQRHGENPVKPGKVTCEWVKSKGSGVDGVGLVMNERKCQRTSGKKEPAL